MLVARATERLAQAAFGIKLYYDAEGEEEREKLFEICVFFIGAAAIAINVIPHIHPDADEAEPTEFKDVLVTELDKRLSEMIDESPRALRGQRARRVAAGRALTDDRRLPVGVRGRASDQARRRRPRVGRRRR